MRNHIHIYGPRGCGKSFFKAMLEDWLKTQPIETQNKISISTGNYPIGDGRQFPFDHGKNMLIKREVIHYIMDKLFEEGDIKVLFNTIIEGLGAEFVVENEIATIELELTELNNKLERARKRLHNIKSQSNG